MLRQKALLVSTGIQGVRAKADNPKRCMAKRRKGGLFLGVREILQSHWLIRSDGKINLTDEPVF